MKLYVVALGTGVLVGVLYGLLNVRSPAPPVVALVGLMGILLGEQVVPIARRLLHGDHISISWLRSECAPHLFGDLPTRASHRRGPDTAA